MPTTLYCSSCGYNLTGVCTSTNPTGNCPECGTPFDFHLLLSDGGIAHPRVTGPLLWLLAPPLVIAGGFLLALWGQEGMRSSSDMREIVRVLGFILGGLAVLGGLVLSIFAARRIARRMVMRPPGTRPSLGSTGLTILFSSIFLCCQGALAFTLFFLGCFLVVISTI